MSYTAIHIEPDKIFQVLETVNEQLPLLYVRTFFFVISIYFVCVSFFFFFFFFCSFLCALWNEMKRITPVRIIRVTHIQCGLQTDWNAVKITHMNTFFTLFFSSLVGRLVCLLRGQSRAHRVFVVFSFSLGWFMSLQNGWRFASTQCQYLGRR